MTVENTVLSICPSLITNTSGTQVNTATVQAMFDAVGILTDPTEAYLAYSQLSEAEVRTAQSDIDNLYTVSVAEMIYQAAYNLSDGYPIISLMEPLMVIGCEFGSLTPEGESSLSWFVGIIDNQLDGPNKVPLAEALVEAVNKLSVVQMTAFKLTHLDLSALITKAEAVLLLNL